MGYHHGRDARAGIFSTQLGALGVARMKHVFDLARRQVPPEHVFARYLPEMKRKQNAQGWTDGGLCPFHDDNRRGSFRVNLRTGGYKCFSCGASGGDTISFVAQFHRIQPLDAAKILAGRG